MKKWKKSTSEEREKFSKPILQQKSHECDKHLGSPPCKLLGIIPKIYKAATRTNWAKDKKVDDCARGLGPEWWYVSDCMCWEKVFAWVN